MALSETRPFGLRDVKVKTWSGGAVGSAVDLPTAKVFKFKPVGEEVTFVGDDRLVGVDVTNESVEWELEADGLSLDARKAILGGTVTDTGTTPNQTKTFVAKVTDQRPYFLVEGQAISESGGDIHGKVYKCKCIDSDGGNENASGTGQSFRGKGVAISAAEATAVGGAAVEDATYEFVQNETAAAIS